MSRMAEQYSDSSKLSARAQLYQRFSTEAQDLSGWVFDRLDLGPRSRVLELGCGPGHLWSSNMRRIPDGWSVTLTDMSPGMLKEAEDNLAGSAGRFSFEVVDAQSIPYGDSGFDTVIANHMLYHVPDRPAAFSEIHRVLTAGGRLFATTLGRGHLRKLYELVEGVAPGAWSGIDSDSFGLENGTEQLSRWFSKVSTHRKRADVLEVTEVDALVPYAQSTGRLSDRQMREFEAVCDREMARNGVIRIETDVCMFEATK